VKFNGIDLSQLYYLYSTFHNVDCVKAASQYQSKHNNNVHFLVENIHVW